MFDAVIEFLPAPNDVDAIKGVLDDKAETESDVNHRMMHHLLVVAFKIMNDKYVGNLTFVAFIQVLLNKRELFITQ